MKRFLAIFLAVALSFSLVGCFGLFDFSKETETPRRSADRTERSVAETTERTKKTYPKNVQTQEASDVISKNSITESQEVNGYAGGEQRDAPTGGETSAEQAPTATPTQKPTLKPSTPAPEGNSSAKTRNYIANRNTKKFHYPSCRSVKQMSEKNKWHFTGTRDQLIAQGYIPCKICKP